MQNKTTEVRSPRGSRLVSIIFEPLGGLFAVSNVRCQATGAKKSPINMDSYLLCIAAFTRRQFERVFVTCHLTIFPLFLCVQHLGKYLMLPCGSLAVVVMTMSHNAWWPAPCEERVLWPTLGWCSVNTKRRKWEYQKNWFGAVQNHPRVKATRDVGLISFFCFCRLLSTMTAVVCRRQCSYIILVITE